MTVDDTAPLPSGQMTHADAMAEFARANIAMVLTNPRLDDNPIIYVNPAFETITGYSASAALGRNCRFLQGEDTDPADRDALATAIKAGTDVAVEIRNYRADGSAFVNQLRISPIRDEADGSISYFIGLQRVVEDDQQVEGAREEMNRALEEIQHRVKNHLSMIVGLIRLQARESGNAEGLGDIGRRVESLQLLYEEMSAIHDNGNRDVIQLGAYLSRVANTIGYLDGRPGIRVNVDVPPILVQTDTAARIGLIVSELLTNAMQHAFEGRTTGLLELRATQLADNGLRVVINDDGRGLPDDIQWPSNDSLGGRIIAGLTDGIGATLDISRGAVGTTITLEAPGVLETD